MEALRRRGQLRYSQDERVNTVLKHLYGNEAVSPVRTRITSLPLEQVWQSLQNNSGPA